MASAAAAILLALAAVSGSGAAKTDRHTAPLELTLSTDRPSYARGKEIVLQLRIHNHGTRPLTIVHPDFWGVSTIRVTTDGKPATPDSFKGQRKAVANLMTILPGQTQVHRFEKLTAWTCCFGYTFHPLPPGRHQIVVSITNPPEKVTPPADWKPDWVGTISSPPVTIEVRKGK